MKIIPLSEGSFTIDKTKLFVPFDQHADDLQSRPAGSLLVEVQPFVIITSNDVILLDTGLGFKTSGMMQLHRNLIENDIHPSQVTKVLLSHLHKDHAGGVSSMNSINSLNELSFPNATYYLQKQELDFAFQKGFPSYLIEELNCLRESDNVVLLEGNGMLNGFIRYEVTAAHSPFHQVFWIDDDGKTLFFGGDDAPQLQQMKNKVVAKYDYDGRKCMELRQKWWKQGALENWTFLFYHDVNSPVHAFHE